MKLLLIITTAIVITTTAYYLTSKEVVKSGVAAGLAPPEVVRAMKKMGPLKDYRLFPSGRLEVRVNGKWLYLKTQK